MSKIARIGASAVPWTVSWSSEEEFYLGLCPEFKRLAIRQASSPGVGKPLFGKPHMDRQRMAMARGLCDLCGRPLKLSTKVSLSHARPMPHGAEGWAILQVEPLLHRACALESMRFCPSLKRQILEGDLRIRQVTRWRAQCAVMTAEYVQTVCSGARKALGHGKVELLQWIDRDMEWLKKGNYIDDSRN
ncbi:MAG: hypothetical protein PHE36_01410 [Novosphingobium sp.]|nr:hypothetical protein [Novosphingobium sp.]